MIPSGLKREIRDKFSQLKSELYKTVYLYLEPNKTDCPNCFITISSGASTNTYNTSFIAPTVIYGNTITPTPFSRGRCPVCYGKGVIEQENRIGVKCLVRWNPSDNDGRLIITPAGTEGTNVVQLKTDECYFEKIRDCKYALIDNIKCELLSPPFIRSLGYQDVVVIAYLSSVDIGSSTRER
jgi:hypothetical protein